MSKEYKTMPIAIPGDLKNQVEKMAKETGINQSTLIRMATHSLVVNYERKGSFIFADLLNPEHKN